MKSGDLQLNLRIPSSLKERIIKSSESNGRSLNAEACWLLDAALLALGTASDEKRIIKELLARIDELKKDQNG